MYIACATERTYGWIIKSVAGYSLMMVWLQTETYVGVFRQFERNHKMVFN
jgi:hypothetical protein